MVVHSLSCLVPTHLPISAQLPCLTPIHVSSASVPIPAAHPPSQTTLSFVLALAPIVLVPLLIHQMPNTLIPVFRSRLKPLTTFIFPIGSYWMPSKTLFFCEMTASFGQTIDLLTSTNTIPDELCTCQPLNLNLPVLSRPFSHSFLQHSSLINICFPRDPLSL